MKKITIWGDSVLKGVVLEEGKDRYSLLKNSSIELTKRELDVDIKNNSKFGLTVTKAMRLIQKSLSKDELPNYALVELGGNDCDYNWKEISENPDGEYFPNTPLPKFIDSINNIIENFRKNGIEPILTNLPPLSSQKYFDWFGKNGLNTDNIKRWMGDINRIYKHQETYSLALMDIANRQKCDLIDIRTPIILEGNTDDFICEDGIHPNEKAHKLMADTFINYISDRIICA
ncbi:MAG: SGNH/GDSL hydrolase family protein [Intestinibacter sp.]|uniref:SGNH/GDSL hydrolase family protein n=1 Tax=Intestinibacter sp. TaxID=1965304 RepID=UPI0025BF7001|nr:SGNH/GDSL hydrolase family protein [Intestinibacter sp.]MCI6736903.1 SGNH/GDSL hydrolase family protein [Intestinibacter sp.]